jgi:hypothetical protein
MDSTPGPLQMNAIVADLQGLVPSVLNCVIVDGMTKVHPLDRDYPGFPAAVVIPPILKESAFEDSANNLRSYTWYVMVVTTPDNIPKTDPTYMAGLEDNVCAVFDLDCTLGGTANGAVMPAVLEPPGPVVYNSVTYVVFYISFIARVLVPASVKIN